VSDFLVVLDISN